MKPYYSHGGIEIFHGDCREVLPTLAPGVFVVDPPYGISHSSNYGASWNGNEIANDGDTDLRDWLLSARGNAPMFMFGTWKIPKPAETRITLIWDNGPASGMGDLSFPWKSSHEEIYVIGDGFSGTRDEAVLRGHGIVTWESKGRCHQHQKPESLIKYLLQKVGKDLLVVDPCMGSGTTLRAAKDLGRRAIGIEIEERYCEIAANRLRQEVLFPAESA